MHNFKTNITIACLASAARSYENQLLNQYSNNLKTIHKGHNIYLCKEERSQKDLLAKEERNHKSVLKTKSFKIC